MKSYLKISTNMLAALLLVACSSQPAMPSTSTSAPAQPTTVATVEENEVSIGDTINLDYVSVKFDAIEISDGYSFSITKKTSVGTSTYSSSIDCPRGMKLVCLRGTFNNLSGKERYSSNKPIFGFMYIDGNEYPMKLDCFISEEAEHMLSIPAKMPLDMYYYAEVPASVADDASTIEAKFGFKENLEPGPIFSLGDLDVVYSLTASVK